MLRRPWDHPTHDCLRGQGGQERLQGRRQLVDLPALLLQVQLLLLHQSGQLIATLLLLSQPVLAEPQVIQQDIPMLEVLLGLEGQLAIGQGHVQRRLQPPSLFLETIGSQLLSGQLQQGSLKPLLMQQPLLVEDCIKRRLQLAFLQLQRAGELPLRLCTLQRGCLGIFQLLLESVTLGPQAGNLSAPAGGWIQLLVS